MGLLTIDSAINAIIDQLKIEMSVLSDASLRHPHKEFSDYQRMVGVYQGLQKALDAVEHVLSQGETDDDEDGAERKRFF